MQFFQVSNFLWITVIAINLYIVVVKQMNPSNFEKLYHGFVWTTSIIFTVIPVFTSSYGYAGIWCWIEHSEVISNIWRFALYYVPVYICFGVIIMFYVIVINTIKKRTLVSYLVFINV